MSLGTYGILIIFGLFVLVMIINPNLSCFGKRIKSPLYPLLRNKHMKKRSPDFRLRKAEGAEKSEGDTAKTGTSKKTEDYGFHLD